ncbi:MAG TPA: PLP-dependent aminotransferase family protein, partial [Thermoanaerobaculia bacterium]
MTIWSPRLPKTDAPLYRRIADALERDVTGGVLLAGGRLPAVRELATRLGVTPVTISRAYAEAAERGLIETNVGRGTFVRETFHAAIVGPESDEIDLTTNEIPVGAFPEVPSERIAAALATGYRTGAGSDRHRSAGAAWIGGDTSPSRVIVTTGTQQALSIAFSTLLAPGQTLLTDPLIYAGIKAIAAHQHLRLEPLAADRYGILPDALERAARNRSSRVVYLTPTLQNPTGAVMPEKRRRDLAAVAEKHGLTIVEDDVYGFLHPTAPAPVRTYAPERTVFVTGVGKALTPALRVGYMHAPDALVPRLTTALFASSMFASAVTAEIAALWIEDGTAARVAKQKRETIATRRRVADRVVGELTSSDVHSAHLWLELPKRWTADAFADEARRRRVR